MPARFQTADEALPSRSIASRAQRGLAAGLLVLLCMLVHLPGLSTIPVVDRDEARFAQASRQMVDGDFPRDWVVPMVQDRPRLNKPPAIYWIQASLVRLFTLGGGEDAIWMYRVASVLGTMVACLATLWIGTRMFGLRCGLLAAVLLAVAPVVVFDAHQARADQVLLATTTLAMGLLWVAWRKRHASRLPWSVTIGLAGLVGVGVLVKGPVTPVVVGGAAFALAWWGREWSWLWRLRPFSSLAAMVAVAMPWVFLAARELGWDVLWARVLEETVGRASEPAEGHSGPPGYHLVLLVGLFWPGSLLAGLGLLRGFGKAWRMPAIDADRSRLAQILMAWRGRRVGRSPELFLVAWFLPGWLAFEIAATKLPHYTLPMYPAVALLAARGLVAASRGWSEAGTLLSRLGFGLWAGLGVAMVAAPAVLAIFAADRGWLGDDTALAAGLRAMPQHHAWLIGVAVLAAAVVIVAAWRLALGGRLLAAQGLALVPAVAGLQATFGVVLPGISHVWTTPRIVAALEAAAASDRPFAAVGYHEDSLIFETRGRVTRLGESDLPTWFDAHPDGVALVPAADFARLVENDPAIGRLQPEAPAIEGFNYSKGDPVELVLVERRGDA